MTTDLELPPQSPLPQGVIALLIAPDGRVVANAAHFDKSGPAGFSQLERQKHYVREKLATAAIKALCAHDLAAALDAYDGTQMISALCNRAKYRIEVVPVGYAEEP